MPSTYEIIEYRAVKTHTCNSYSEMIKKRNALRKSSRTSFAEVFQDGDRVEVWEDGLKVSVESRNVDKKQFKARAMKA